MATKQQQRENSPHTHTQKKTYNGFARDAYDDD